MAQSLWSPDIPLLLVISVPTRWDASQPKCDVHQPKGTAGCHLDCCLQRAQKMRATARVPAAGEATTLLHCARGPSCARHKGVGECRKRGEQIVFRFLDQILYIEESSPVVKFLWNSWHYFKDDRFWTQLTGPF